MKRMFAIILALLMLCASAAAEGRDVSIDHFSLTLPSDWEIESDPSDDGEGYQSLGFFYSPDVTGLNIEAYRIFSDDWSDTTMMGADAALQQDYIESVLDNVAEYTPVYVDTVYTYEGIPLVVISYSDELGPLFYAETVLNGTFYCLYIYAYTDDTYSVARELTQEDLTLTEEILSSIRFSLF